MDITVALLRAACSPRPCTADVIVALRGVAHLVMPSVMARLTNATDLSVVEEAFIAGFVLGRSCDGDRDLWTNPETAA